MLVSVIIPSFERFESLNTAIQSVLNQTYPKIEIIIIDDCSQDPRYQELDKIYHYSPVVIVHLPENMRHKHKLSAAQGLTKNEGLKLARGDYIAFLDDDDAYCDENKLQYQIDMLEKYKCGLCCSNMYIGNGMYDRNITYPLYFNKNFELGNRLERHVYLFNKLHIESVNYINNSSVVIHSKVIEQAGLFGGGINEDYRYWKKVINYTDGIYTQDITTYYDSGHAGKVHYTT
jgi:glycosyltransferase involved in cell wall biosynthesis